MRTPAITPAPQVENIAATRPASPGAFIDGPSQSLCADIVHSAVSVSATDDVLKVTVAIPEMHCGACVARLEYIAGTLPHVQRIRANLARRQLVVEWHPDNGNTQTSIASVQQWVQAIETAGFSVVLTAGKAQRADADSAACNQRTASVGTDPVLHSHIKALAVSGFAAANVMMLSVAVWSGAGAKLSSALHGLSLLIAVPAIAYSGRVFFRSALHALRSGHVNMDVPVSIGIISVLILSTYDTVHGTGDVYFESAVMLIFFLLAGRTLERTMRNRAEEFSANLASFLPQQVTRVAADGNTTLVATGDVKAGDIVRVAADTVVPADGVVTTGSSEIDTAMMTGESAAVAVAAGDIVLAGTRNVLSPLLIHVQAQPGETRFDDMLALMHNWDAAEQRPALAERAARWYAPVVHLSALLTGMAWYVVTDDWHHAVSIAVAVLIITCPCALALAIPMVQMVASQILFRKGILLKRPLALEQLAAVDSIVFDKTGTLSHKRMQRQHNITERTPAVRFDVEPATLLLALASQSTHPVARAVAAVLPNTTHCNQTAVAFDALKERAGQGIEARLGTHRLRLGRAAWALATLDSQNSPAILVREHQSAPLRTSPPTDIQQHDTVFAIDGQCFASFRSLETPLDDAAEVIAQLRSRGLRVLISSGDHRRIVEDVSRELGDLPFEAESQPAEKLQLVVSLQQAGATVLFVGDGLNDSAAMTAADVAMAPASGAEIGRNCADIVYVHPSLSAVVNAVDMAHFSQKLVRQNLWISAGYNALVLPLAVAGLVTPLLAAVSMSVSSILVIANAMRLNIHSTPDTHRPKTHKPMLQQG